MGAGICCSWVMNFLKGLPDGIQGRLAGGCLAGGGRLAGGSGLRGGLGHQQVDDRIGELICPAFSGQRICG